MSDDAAKLTLQAHTRSAEETQHLAARLATALEVGDVVALEGELGAGKTCFVRGLAQGLGVDPSLISSPTFVLVHEHEGTRVPLTHIDAYRITSADDLETIGWSEMLASKDSVIAVEWPSRIATSLPARRIDVTIETVSEYERLIRITAPREMHDRLRRVGLTATGSPNTRAVKCRTCGKPIDAGVRTYPFCSDRCRMADLGGWFTGAHKLTRPMQAEDAETD
jgi:tRNA threonylcarbamoyladenosine biosynthesis protein TsaE